MAEIPGPGHDLCTLLRHHIRQDDAHHRAERDVAGGVGSPGAEFHHRLDEIADHVRAGTVQDLLGRINDRALGLDHTVEEGSEFRQLVLGQGRAEHLAGEAPHGFLVICLGVFDHPRRAFDLDSEDLAELGLGLRRIIGRRRRQQGDEIDRLGIGERLGVLRLNRGKTGKGQHDGGGKDPAPRTLLMLHDAACHLAMTGT
jgi:hypothetical protein